MQQEISTSSRDEAFWFYCCIVKPESPRFFEAFDREQSG
jgi:hypothetical protein